MKTLIYKSSRYTSGWEELGGHGCLTEDEMHEYAAAFAGKSDSGFKVVDAPYDPGTFIPEDQRERVDPMPELTKRLKEGTPEERERIITMMREVIAALRK